MRRSGLLSVLILAMRSKKKRHGSTCKGIALAPQTLWPVAEKGHAAAVRVAFDHRLFHLQVHQFFDPVESCSIESFQSGMPEAPSAIVWGELEPD
jgi:hypothetical protein